MIPANAAPLAIALLGLLLGMRHATDPDHVIAITTILSRERRLAVAARIGVVWGLGHTITVLIVGAAIIVFKIAIPTRLGLAMEFAVAVVLILLGVGAAASLVRKGATRIRGASSSDEAPGRPCARTYSRRRDACASARSCRRTRRSRRRDASRSSHPGRRIAVVRRATPTAQIIRSRTRARTRGQRGDRVAGPERDSRIRCGRRSTSRFSASAR